MSAESVPAPPYALGPAAFKIGWMRGVAIWSLIVVLAWAPFPLGSAVSWGAGLLEMMIAACWVLWLAANWQDSAPLLPRQRLVAVALILVLAVLFWAVVQITPWAPASWAHPAWQVASDGLGQSVPATISMDTWRSEAEILKLASTVAACWLAYSMAQRVETALLLFTSIIVIGAAYSLYGFALAFSGQTQATLIYGLPFSSGFVTGPFMLHNSFATYTGLCTLAATARLFHAGRETVVSKRGSRQFAISLIQFIFGRGALLTASCLVLFGAVVASASRGGFAATSLGLAAMALISLIRTLWSRNRIWPTLGIFAAIAPIFILLVASGGQLSDRVDQLIDAGSPDDIRLALWVAAERMIADSPWRGLGLGTFQDAYPLYATHAFPFVMDKAHCDYLEFAAGIGLPAAIAWWLAIVCTGLAVARGAIRRRNALYALAAAGATVLVAVHSAMDFSLQMPAVALCFAALLGIGLAQSGRTART